MPAKDFTLEGCAKLLGGVVIVAILALLFTAISEPHRVEFYYLESYGNNGLWCSAESIDWQLDVNAFCSTDIDKTMEVIRQANESLHRK